MVQDANGSTVALGTLGPASFGGGEEDGQTPIKDIPCIYTVSIDAVPLGDKFYSIQVGSTAPVSMTQEELIDPSQVIQLN